jgi:deazaflavin-dependent oxidoreductase (nitroreductase family)
MPDVFLYLTTTGRKTGRPRRIEIWYVERQGRCYMVSERRDRSHWVRNLLADPQVRFSVGTRDDPAGSRAETAATARVVCADAEPALVAAVRRLMDDKYGWSDGLVVELTPLGS